MGVKFAVALGADVTVISTSESKRQDALRMGAKHFIISKDPEQMKSVQKTFNMILDTVSADHDVEALLNLLAFEGVYCIVGYVVQWALRFLNCLILSFQCSCKTIANLCVSLTYETIHCLWKWCRWYEGNTGNARLLWTETDYM